MHDIFLSCDWGTSNFRLRIIDSCTLAVIALSQSDEGVAAVFEHWQQAAEATERVFFYQSIMLRHIGVLEQRAGRPLAGVPIVISGMASSSIGMKELPYKRFPFFAAGADLMYEAIESTEPFNHRIILVSGARTETDVMRGEETQLAGCVSNAASKPQVFIFPGTHSKHVTIEDGFATNFATYMTGEFFHLLSTNSILSKSVAPADALQETPNTTAFKSGVLDGRNANLLHQCFMVRTNELFQTFSKKENYWYLSGLLIGAELCALPQATNAVTIVGSGTIVTLYQLALDVLGIQTVDIADATEAITKAHAMILKKVEAHSEQ